jgi:formylmethanofuran--tetrahydromethanopterin N-formyltransferase
MQLRGVFIDDTFAEAFTVRVARVIITARSPRWAREAALKLTGFATSVIGCKCEAGVETELQPSETPDATTGFPRLRTGSGSVPRCVSSATASRRAR